MISNRSNTLYSNSVAWCFSLVCTVILMSVSSSGFVQQALGQTEINPGTTEFFDSATSGRNIPAEDCNPLICGSTISADKKQAGAFAILAATTTQRARQSSVLVEPFNVPESVLGETPVNTVLDARVTGSVKWRGTLWTIDLSTLGMVEIPAMGPTAEAFIRASLVDVTDPSQPFEAGNASIANFACDPIDRTLGAEIPIPLISDGVELAAHVGWCEENNEDTFNFGAKVIQGHEYELHLTMICQAITGVAPTLLSACTFSPTPLQFDLAADLEGALDNLDSNDLEIQTPDVTIVMPSISTPINLPTDCCDFTLNIDIPDISIPGTTLNFSVLLKGAVKPILTTVVDAIVPKIDNGFLQWDYMTVTIDPDILGLLESSKNEILTEVGVVRADIEVVRKGVANNIRLLHTPEGRRSTTYLTGDPDLSGYPDLCADGNCNWPEN